MNHSINLLIFCFSTGLNIVPSEISFEYVTALTMHWYLKNKILLGMQVNTASYKQY